MGFLSSIFGKKRKQRSWHYVGPAFNNSVAAYNWYYKNMNSLRRHSDYKLKVDPMDMTRPNGKKIYSIKIYY